MLRRGDTVLSAGVRALKPGLNRVLLRDVVRNPGTVTYSVDVGTDADRMPENNRGIAAMRVEGRRAVLVLNDDGSAGPLTRALRAGGLAVEVATPESARLDAVALSGFRAVVLENVAADRVGPSMRALRAFVEDLGGGLLMTGGKASFGIGGYHRSVLDELLPVSMEMRQEHRKQGVALAIAMDRSGSMAAAASAGLTKMDLANRGAAAAIELLSPMDSVAVIAVDSAPHVVQPLVAVTDGAGLGAKVRRIQSMGGGIFVHSALVAAGRQLEGAPQKNRHIILFSDAADSEEQNGCPELLAEFEKRNITTSVIALGTAADSDAQFLRDVARRGRGTCYFSTDPTDLPRLFAHDTLKVARSTFVEETTACRVLPDLLSMGELPARSFPGLPGHNLTYVRDGAAVGIVAENEYRAPVLAFVYRGLGRTAAYTGQIGGSYGEPIVAWEGFATLFVTLGRWLAGQDPPQDFFADVERRGREAVVSVELDPDAATPPDPSQLRARMLDAEGNTRILPLERVGEHRFEARMALASDGVAVGAVQIDDRRQVRLPPVVLPYSPEFERSPDPGKGERTLRRLTEVSGGAMGPAAAELFRGDRDGRTVRSVARPLMLAALLLMLLEIAGRRLQWWSSLRLPSGLLRAGRSAPATAAPDAVRDADHRQVATRTRAAPRDDPCGRPRLTAQRRDRAAEHALQHAGRTGAERIGRRRARRSPPPRRSSARSMNR